MGLHPLAGQPAPKEMLINIPRLVAAYYSYDPDPGETEHLVSFGTSGHRGSSWRMSFNEAHILAITQAICEHRARKGISGPLFLGKDTHALSEPAFISALEVFAANKVDVYIQKNFGYTPTPVISHAILRHNKARKSGLADGVVITPSHNPPEDGGVKYNPPEGGPADTETTKEIESRANEILRIKGKDIQRIPFKRAILAETTHEYDYIQPYVDDLQNVLDMQAIAEAGLKIGVDPLGGSGLDFWEPIAQRFGLDIEVVNKEIDPRFSFLRVDKDGKLRMDCSSEYAMSGLIELKDRFDVAFGNDADYDRHGIVTKDQGLLNPNHYLSAAVWYLFQNRPQWKEQVAVGKTLVSSSMIDRVANFLQRPLKEVPVGFKWFVSGLLSGEYGFAGEESAGASFLRLDGTAWSTDKDGIIMDLLAAEMTAKLEKDPGQLYFELEERFGKSYYERIDAAADFKQKEILKKLSPESIAIKELGGESVSSILTHAPANQAPIGGLKVVAQNSWFAARPSGTEDMYKIYAESFKSLEHLKQIQGEAQELVQKEFAKQGA